MIDLTDWIAKTRDLKAAEAGILINLVVTMHERGEPIRDDYSRMARLCGADPRTFKRTVDMFLGDGRVIRRDGGLWSNFVQTEDGEATSTDEGHLVAIRLPERSKSNDA